MSSFHIGQRIVCINDDWYPQALGPYTNPKKGGLYHVRGFFPWDGLEWSPFISLIGIVDQRANITGPFFTAHFFRPVIERPTSISVFTKLLAPSPKELERA